MAKPVKQNYHNRDEVSQSDLKMFAKSRRLYYEVRCAKTRNRKPPTASQQRGQLIEDVLLRPDSTMVIPKSALTANGQRRGKAWHAFQKEYEDWVLLTEQEDKMRSEIWNSIERHPRAHRILTDHLADASISPWGTWPCPYTGMDRRAELDVYLPDVKLIVDIKTTVNPLPGGFDDEAWRWGYWIQAATYREFMQSQGEDVAGFVIVAIRNEEPWEVELHIVPQSQMDAGDRWNERKMHELQRAIEADDWGPRTAETSNCMVMPGGYVGRMWDD